MKIERSLPTTDVFPVRKSIAEPVRMFLLACCWLSLFAPVMVAQAVPAEHANEARIDRLLKQMTLEEKLDLIRGNVEPALTYQGQAGYLRGIPRLGIPGLRFADGPPGVLTRVAGQAQTATMGVAATWSIRDAELNGVAIGKEARSLGIDVVLQPFINIDRDITFARAYNTLGEDPMLSGAIGAAEIRGEQGQGVMSQAKHYIGYDTDGSDVVIDQQTLHEVYAAPFAAAVDAGVASIMCSYNRINGTFACGNPAMLKTILRDQMGFKGFVTSDWGAVHNVHFINQGLTMEMPGYVDPSSPFGGMMKFYFDTGAPPKEAPAKFNTAALAGMLGGNIPEERNAPGFDMSSFRTDSDPAKMRDGLADKTITEATITEAARRVLYEIDRFGFLDGKQKHTITSQDLDGNGKIIEQTAEDAAVLLKNDGQVLPLKSTDLDSLAFIGPTAGQIASIGTFGERSPGIPARQVGPLEALKQLVPTAKVTYAVADDMTGSAIKPELFSHDGKAGLTHTNAAGHTTVDQTIDFTKKNGAALLANSTDEWSGEITVPADGEYWFYLQVLGTRGVFSIDGKDVGKTGATKGTVHGDVQHADQDNVLPTTDGLDNVRRAVSLTKGSHPIQVKITPDGSDLPVQVRLSWTTPESRKKDHDDALSAAKSAKTVVVFAWTRDKPKFHLPGDQDDLIAEIAAINPNTIVVLNTSQPIAMPWLDKVKSVLEMWWPGDEGGLATAKTLVGQSNPGGRLPMTWAKVLTDYPATSAAHPERTAKGVEGKTTFSEGVLVGYRWFDDQKTEPLYPFGFGLGYGQLTLSGVKASRTSDGGATVSVHISNVGKVTADEVPQVYLDAPLSKPDGIQFAPKTLVAFDRVRLKAGESRDVTLHITKRAFEYWSESDGKWDTAPGSRTLHVGNSSRSLPLTAVLQ